MNDEGEIELRVDYHHPSGRYTLMEKRPWEPLRRDVMERDLFSNTDKAAFYKAVARKIADLALDGVRITYVDSPADGPN
jgi:hypothetical protein